MRRTDRMRLEKRLATLETAPPAGGVSAHGELSGNGGNGCHPMSAISGLVDALGGKAANDHGHEWDAITGKPALFSGAYADLSGKPTLFSGAYADLSDKPTLGDAAAKNVGTGASDVAAGNHTHPGGGSALDAWPVGSVYIAIDSTSPATRFGGGTWAAFGAGKVLVGRDAGDTDFDTAEETGGAKTKAISAHAGAAVADHAAHTHTYTDVPNHVHTLATGTGSTGNFAQVIGTVDTSSGGTGAAPTQTALGTRSGNPVTGVASGTTSAPSATLSHSVTQPSSHADLNVVQPYIVVYMWKRVA